MVKDIGRGTALLVARLGLAAVFWAHGVANVQQTQATAARLLSMGYPAPEVFAWIGAVAELSGALALTLGFLTPVACVGLIMFLIPTTYSFHLPGALAGDAAQVDHVLKNLAIIGGLVALIFSGPGRYSADARVLKGPGS